MELLSIQIGVPEEIRVGERWERSGINKRPVDRARIDELGLADDHVVDTEHHGGPGQAVYLYSAEDYAWWEAELGRSLEPGTFGENLTVSGWGPEELRVGDRFTIGVVELELTSCRIPCATFSARMGEDGWIRRFRDARRPGAYARVLATGEVAAGDAVERHLAPSSNVTILDTQDLYYGDLEVTVERLHRFLVSPVGDRNRRAYQRQLAELDG